MPQLISHRDGFGWQTPNIADILHSPPQTEDQTRQLRGLATTIVRRLAELGTPVRLKDMDRFRSQTRYHLIPEKVGRPGKEQAVTLTDLQAVLPILMSEMSGAQAAELVKLKAEDPAISLFLRNDLHRPLGLREVMEHRAFLDTPGYQHFSPGMDLDHQPLLFNLKSNKHLLIIGQEPARFDLQLSVALGLALFNSPSYLRLAFVGTEASPYKALLGGPHTLGNLMKTAASFRRFLEGMSRHIQQRKAILKKEGAEDIDQFNHQALSDKNMRPLPHILVLLDTPSLSDWAANQSEWLVPLHYILAKGAEVGVHTLMNVVNLEPLNFPERLAGEFPSRLLLASAIAEQSIPLPPEWPVAFVDGLYQEGGAYQPFEAVHVQDGELARLSTYWLNIRNRRNSELEGQGQAQTSGNTGLLTLRADILPPAGSATATLSNEDTRPTTAYHGPIITDKMVSLAQALSAYLGWIGVGPLRDVLQMSPDEAMETVKILQAIGIVEEGEGPAWRFVRLGDLPHEPTA